MKNTSHIWAIVTGLCLLFPALNSSASNIRQFFAGGGAGGTTVTKELKVVSANSYAYPMCPTGFHMVGCKKQSANNKVNTYSTDNCGLPQPDVEGVGKKDGYVAPGMTVSFVSFINEGMYHNDYIYSYQLNGVRTSPIRYSEMNYFSVGASQCYHHSWGTCVCEED